MTTTAFSVLLGCLAGAALSVLHFGGLWLTVQSLPTARRPWLVTIGSAVARLGVSLVGFYLMMRFGWEALVGSLAGFLSLRFMLLQYFEARRPSWAASDDLPKGCAGD